MVRSPPWVEDELLVVLDIYLKERRVLEEYEPAVVSASELLNRLPLHTQAGEPGFRTPDAVVLRLANFRAHDPSSSAKGMANSGRLAGVVWRQYATRPDSVARLVDAIREVATHDGGAAAGEPEDGEIGVPEGRLLYRAHRGRERDPRLRARKLKQMSEGGGSPRCEACGLVPEAVYGPGTDRILECHHLSPLFQGERVTRLSDLAVVCSNCHGALHARGLSTTLDELRSSLVGRV